MKLSAAQTSIVPEPLAPRKQEDKTNTAKDIIANRVAVEFLVGEAFNIALEYTL
jgi:hypothetical protein